MPDESEFNYRGEVCKVDRRLGLVFGYAIVCKIGGEEYFDKQGDHIGEDAMLEAALDFMVESRRSGDMHVDKHDGQVVFAFPITEDIAEQLDLMVKKTGLLVGMRPSPEVFKLFESGARRQFSIGGKRVEDEVVA